MLKSLSRNPFIPYITCFLVTGIFSIHYLVAKEILSHGVSPYSLSAWRGLIGGAIILFFTRSRISLSSIFNNKLQIIIIATLGFFLNQIFFMNGLKLTSALSTSLISNTIPIITFAFAFILKVESINCRKLSGLLISFVLISILLFSKNRDASTLFNTGNLLIFLNVFSFCLAFVLGKKLISGKNFSFEVLTGLMLMIGGLLMAFFFQSNTMDLINYGKQGHTELLLVLFEIIVSTSIAYFLNIWTLKKLEPTIVSFFIYFQPIITSIGEIIFHNKFPSPQSIFIYIGILLGGFLVLTSYKYSEKN